MERIMKRVALLMFACGMLAGCDKVRMTGSEIVFQASSVPTATRTAYSGERTSGSGVVKERIDWVKDDMITVWSDKARTLDNAPYQDYIIKTVETDDDRIRSRATGKATGDNGLLWEPALGPYTFYARYPNDQEKLDGNKMTGTIPATQTLLYDSETGAIRPDMQYAFMFAKATAPVDAENVILPFAPMFTALEFEVGGGGNGQVDLTSFKLTSTTDAITGGFEVACANGTASLTGTPGLTASLDFSNLPNGKLTVTGTTPVTVTLFGVPKDLKNLTLEVKGDQILTRTLKLSDKNGNMLKFDACKKYRLLGLSLPELLKAEGEDVDWDIQAIGEPLIWD